MKAYKLRSWEQAIRNHWEYFNFRLIDILKGRREYDRVKGKINYLLNNQTIQ
jgi:hypothetical protein